MNRKLKTKPLAAPPADRRPQPKIISISSLVTEHCPVLRDMFAESMLSMREVFAARRIVLNRDGDPVDLGPDYRKRIAQFHFLLNLCTRGIHPTEPSNGEFKMNWDDFQKLIRDNPEIFREDGLPPVYPQVEPVPQVETKSERPVGSAFRRKSFRICDLTEAHGEEIEQLFEIGLQSIRNINTARITKLNRDGDMIDLGPDTDCILAATNLLLTLSIRGRKLLTPPTPEHISPTWDQFCQKVQENKAKGEDG